MKKILLDGLKIQNEKGNVEKENEKWNKRVNSILNKYNMNDSEYYLTLHNGKKEACSFERIMDYIASKNLPSVYLINNNVVFENEYGTTIELLSKITFEEYLDRL